MRSGGDGHDEASPRRTVIYCVVPSDLEALHEPLRRHFREDPSVEVVVERRSTDDRRSDADRRVAGKPYGERRLIRARKGRRVGDRRAPGVPVEPPVRLPRRARAHADRLVFLERLEPTSEQVEDADTARLVARFQAGEEKIFAELYMRYFDRVYNYLQVLVRDSPEAEDLAQSVFLKVMEGLSTYERRPGYPFRVWLFTIVKNQALTHLRKHSRADVSEPVVVDRHREERQAVPDPAADRALGWITDRDLLLFVERLPTVQRQVLLLRFLLGLSSAEAGQVLDLSPVQVRKLQSRAVSFLRTRLAAIRTTAADSRCRPPRFRTRPSQAFVVRSRKFMLGRR